MANNETTTLGDLIASLERKVEKATGGRAAPVYLEAGDRQYGIDMVDVETDEDNGPGVWIHANDETLDI